MKNFLFGCTLAMASLTMTQGYAEYCCPPPCDPGCCAADFNGFYVGGNIGVNSDTFHINDLDGFFPVGGTRTVNTTNFTAGVIVGYDMECCNKLLGIVADWNWVNNEGRSDSLTGEFHRHSFDWFTTIRARAGLTICDALIYVTLGAAVQARDFRGESDIFKGHHSFTRWGWASGAGVEYLLGCNWSLGGEILFLNFDEHHKRIDPAHRLGFSHNTYVGRVILNYRFGNLFGL